MVTVSVGDRIRWERLCRTDENSRYSRKVRSADRASWQQTSVGNLFDRHFFVEWVFRNRPAAIFEGRAASASLPAATTSPWQIFNGARPINLEWNNNHVEVFHSTRHRVPDIANVNRGRLDDMVRGFGQKRIH